MHDNGRPEDGTAAAELNSDKVSKAEASDKRITEPVPNLTVVEASSDAIKGNEPSDAAGSSSELVGGSPAASGDQSIDEVLQRAAYREGVELFVADAPGISQRALIKALASNSVPSSQVRLLTKLGVEDGWLLDIEPRANLHRYELADDAVVTAQRQKALVEDALAIVCTHIHSADESWHEAVVDLHQACHSFFVRALGRAS